MSSRGTPHIRRAFVAFVASLVAASFGAAKSAADVDVYRAISLQTLAEEETTLAAQAHGGNLVVVVMKGHWCAVCAKELLRFAGRRKDLAKSHATVVGLNADVPKANRGRAAVDSIPFEILSDRSTAALRALRLWAEEVGHPIPAVVVFDRCGKEHARQVGRAPGNSSLEWTIRILGRLEKNPPRCEEPNS